MCGVAGVFGPGDLSTAIEAMVGRLRHRGPDARGIEVMPGGALGSTRLSIIDLSPAGTQPLQGPGGTWIAFNGEIYNHVELRRELTGHAFRTRTDTEVLLAAYERWGAGCLDRLIGMFAVAWWDEPNRSLVAARDRFGVKPLYHATVDDRLLVASEIDALFAAGVPAEPDSTAWATYLATGRLDHTPRTFWHGVSALPAGHLLRWRDGTLSVEPWYDVAERVGDEDDRRPLAEVEEEYADLLGDSVRLRFRADVPVGIALSGGLDSATLLGLVGPHGGEGGLTAYTFTTGDDRYDELPWVRQMLERTPHHAVEVRLEPDAVPALAGAVQRHQDEPFGGLPTLAYTALFQRARADGTIVVLDGQGMDEQWAGYDYFATPGVADAPVVQGTADPPVRPDCLRPEFAGDADDWSPPTAFTDPLRRLQHRDLGSTKLPRALRFTDRASMQASVELREPFLDHRLVELALRQPADRKIRDGVHKWSLRRISADLLPQSVVDAPKRPVQTPQREWLRGPLRGWAEELVDVALGAVGDTWLEPDQVRDVWDGFARGEGDNGYFAWQWVNLGLAVDARPAAFGVAA